MPLFGFLSSKRAKNMASVAKELGLDYARKDEFGLLKLLLDFKLCGKGRSKKITNIIRPSTALQEEQYCIFDYKFERGGGESRSVHRTTVFFMNSKKLGLPEFHLKPETFFLKVAQYLGFKEDIDFVEHPEFSEKNYLVGEDEGFIRSTFDNNDLTYFFTIENNWSLEGINYYLIFYRKTKRDDRLEDYEIKNFIQKGMQVFEMLKKGTF